MKISMKALYCISTIGLIAHESACGMEDTAKTLKDEVKELAKIFTSNEQIAGQTARWSNDTTTYEEELNTLNDLKANPELDTLIEFVKLIKDTELPTDNGEDKAKPYKTIGEELTEAGITGVNDLNTFLTYLEGDHFNDLRLEPMTINIDALDKSYIIPKTKAKVTIYRKKNEILTEEQQKEKAKEVIKSDLIIKNITKEQIAETLKDKVKHDIPEAIIDKMISEHANDSSEKKEIVKIYEQMIQAPEVQKQVIEENYGEEIEQEIYTQLQKIKIETTKDEIITDVKKHMIQEITTDDLKPYASIITILTEHGITNVSELPAGKEKNLSNIYGENEIITLIAAQQTELEQERQKLKAGIKEFNTKTKSTYKETYTLSAFLKDLANAYNNQKKKVTEYNKLKKGGALVGVKGSPNVATKEINDLKMEVQRLKQELEHARQAKPITKPEIMLTNEEKAILMAKLGEVNDKTKAKEIVKKLGLK